MSRLPVSRPSKIPLCAVAALCFGMVGLPAGSAWACRTPVFRYAMYNWPCAPYWVFSIRRGPPTAEDQAIEQAIRRAAADRDAPANLRLETADADAPEEFDKLPDQVQAAYHAWREQAQSEGREVGAVHLVFTAWGAHLWTGRLTEAAIAALLGSPARREIGRAFDQGHAAVIVLLATGHDKADREAERVVDTLLAEAARGKFVAEIPLDPYEQLMPARGSIPAAGAEPDGPTGGNEGPPQSDSPADVPLGMEPTVRETLRLAKVVVRRDDPSEQRLVDSLLAVESDLAERADDAMVFIVYGRGRALPPCVGKGITVEYLAEAVSFLAAACSCQVKDENPGMDLLMAWNWDATAEKWASGDPELSAAVVQPETNVPRPGINEPRPGKSEPPTGSNEPRARVRGATPPTGRSGSDNSPTGGGSLSASDSASAAADRPTRGGGADEATTTSAGDRSVGAYAGLRTIGLGIALAAVLVLAAGFVLTRRRGDAT